MQFLLHVLKPGLQLLVAEYREPVVLGTILAPATYLSNIMTLCNDKRGEQRSVENIDQTRLNIQYLFPLNEIVTNFFDELKSVTSGYASFDYEDAGYQPADLHRWAEVPCGRGEY